MQTKLLNEIVQEIAGLEALPVLDILIGKKDINEFVIAKKTKMTINQIRNIFYRLSNFGLVSFTRKKDKRKGWYTYFWTLNILRVLELLDERLKKEIENTKAQLKSRETKRFYLCNTCKTEIGEETALLHDFACQECGEVYVLNEDKKIFKELNNKISRLERQREEVQEDLVKARQDKNKKVRRAEKRYEAKKKKDRDKKRHEKAQEKIKLGMLDKKTKKKKTKKVSKKSVKKSSKKKKK